MTIRNLHLDPATQSGRHQPEHAGEKVSETVVVNDWQIGPRFISADLAVAELLGFTAKTYK